MIPVEEKPLYKRVKRSKFEILMDIIELCRFPGLPRTRLMEKSNLNYIALQNFMIELIENGILIVETRSFSYTGQKRETKYLVSTKEGNKIIDQFKEIKKNLSI